MKIKIDQETNLIDLFNEDSPYTDFFFTKGIYNAKLVIRKNGIKIHGENGVVFRNGDYYHKIMNDNNECNTFRTYTIKVLSDNVIMENITIENISVPSSLYGQAVALHVMGDNFLCKNCILKSAQDTLFTGPLPENLLVRYKDFLPKEDLRGNPSRQKFINTTIYGDVDFIFGGAKAYFYKCKLICIGTHGYVCAPSHAKEVIHGYLFHECEILSESGTPSFYLARPWRDYGIAAFINCHYSKHIFPQGFNDWDIPARRRTLKFYEYSPLFDTSNRVDYVKQLSKDEAKDYVLDYLKNF